MTTFFKNGRTKFRRDGPSTEDFSSWDIASGPGQVGDGRGKPGTIEHISADEYRRGKELTRQSLMVLFVLLVYNQARRVFFHDGQDVSNPLGVGESRSTITTGHVGGMRK
jgi:hypothetical protein